MQRLFPHTQADLDGASARQLLHRDCRGRTAGAGPGSRRLRLSESESEAPVNSVEMYDLDQAESESGPLTFIHSLRLRLAGHWQVDLNQ
jgi:hypothetical protein